jgi:SET domain-containing protein
MLLVETYLAESPGMGLGVFSKHFIKKGTVIWEFVEGFDIEVKEDKYDLLTDVQKAYVDKYFWKEANYYYSSCDYSNFQNHSFTPNSIPLDDKMIAARDILADEEILVNYQTFDDDFNSYKDTLK